MLRNTKSNAGFRGAVRKKRYFEGWYIRLSSAESPWSCALIPGIAMDYNGEKSAFIQMIESEGSSHYIPIDYSDFQAKTDEFDVRIGVNQLSEERIAVDLRPNGVDFKLDLKLDKSSGFESDFHPLNVMGWMSKMPFLPCYHHILQMKTPVSGTVEWKGNSLPFNRGFAYIEKDWGTSFPKKWNWLQSSMLSNCEGALSAVTSYVPILGVGVPAGMAAIQIDNERFFWSSAWGHSWKVRGNQSEREIRFRNSSHELLLNVYQGRTAPLIAPIAGKMERSVLESIDGQVSVELKSRNGDRIYSGEAIQAGVELIS